MKGYVPTPRDTVDTMVEVLFRGRVPSPNSTVLDPGCGTGPFIDGVIRWCERRRIAIPCITGVESDPRHLEGLRAKYKPLPTVRVEHADFLAEGRAAYDFIVGNPPYVAITALSEHEKQRYRARFTTARGRFDLYLLFFEQAIRRLAPGGRLVFITPEKYLYVETAGPLRDLIARLRVEEIRLVHGTLFTRRPSSGRSCARRSCARTSVKRRSSGSIGPVRSFHVIRFTTSYRASPPRSTPVQPQLSACGQRVFAPSESSLATPAAARRSGPRSGRRTLVSKSAFAARASGAVLRLGFVEPA